MIDMPTVICHMTQRTILIRGERVGERYDYQDKKAYTSRFTLKNDSQSI